MGSVALPKSSSAKTVLGIGPFLLFLAACAYGALETHMSTDTWIGLAAGRQILELGRVPTTDSFSFTFTGEPWFNQNWGTHLIQYWLYDRCGPNAVIYGTWALICGTYALVGLGAYFRSRTWIGAALAAAVVAIGCRDYMSPRPATTGFFCMAALWALLCALEGEGGRRRWWPIWLLLPTLLFWGCVHGSFTFGFGILGLFVLVWLLLRCIKPAWNELSGRQIAAIVGVVAAAMLLLVAFGPFGFSNFTHGEKVASSETFRGVSEWRPPLRFSSDQPQLPLFPPVWRYWLILGGSVLALVIAQVLGAIYAGRSPESPPHRVRLSLFDPIPLAIGLAMSLWARRFGPVFFIFAAPVVTVWIMRLTAGVTGPARQRLLTALCGLAIPAAGLVAWETASKAHEELVVRHAATPELNLLERVTYYQDTPQDAIDYLKNNQLTPKTFIEWTQAGPLMFYWPEAKVFMDGRAQQVYDEATYLAYTRIVYDRAPRDVTLDALNEAGKVAVVSPPPRVEAVLLRMGRAAPLNDDLERSPAWVVAYFSQKSILFIRRDSEAFRRMTERIAAGNEWRPDTGEAHFSRGKVLLAMQPPNLEGAIAAFQRSAAFGTRRAVLAVSSLRGLYLYLDRLDEARAYFTRLKADAPKLPDMTDADRQNLLFQIDEALKQVDQRVSTRPAASRPDP